MGMKTKFNVTGMTCSACSAHVDKSVRKLEGVSDVNVNLLANSMVVDYDEKTVTPEEIIKAVEKGGYGASLPAASAGEAPRQSAVDQAKEETRKVKVRLILSFVFMIPLFYLAMGHMMSWPLPAFSWERKTRLPMPLPSSFFVCRWPM